MQINIYLKQNLIGKFNEGINLVKIGREFGNNIVLQDTKVSRNHLVIEKQENLYKVKDLNSLNGTFINGNKINRNVYYFLSPGDSIRVGNTVLRMVEDVIKGKKRHWFLTTWLILIIVGNIASALIYLLMGDKFYYLPRWAIPALIVLILIYLVGVTALFKWKKWGFWVLCGTSVAFFVVNLLIGVVIGSALGSFIAVPILYGVLNIGKENKGWTQLD